MGKFLSSSTRRNSCPTAPLAPTIATFIFSTLLIVNTFFIQSAQMHLVSGMTLYKFVRKNKTFCSINVDNKKFFSIFVREMNQ
jgi:hypothetical protein